MLPRSEAVTGVAGAGVTLSVLHEVNSFWPEEASSWERSKLVTEAPAAAFKGTPASVRDLQLHTELSMNEAWSDCTICRYHLKI